MELFSRSTPPLNNKPNNIFVAGFIGSPQMNFIDSKFDGANLEVGFADWILTFQDRGFSGSPYNAGKNRTYLLDSLPHEFPTQGTGDYRS